MRADRLISILMLLQVRGRMTARDLAGRLEVSERTICRDMEALSGAGVPVLAERGQGGGWSLIGGYQTNLTGLNRSEIEALFLGKPTQLLADLGLAEASAAALAKLLAALPSISRHSAEFVRQRIYIDGEGWRAVEEKVPHLPLLQQAIWHERQVAMSYGQGENGVVERLVHPLGLVAKGHVWYLLAMVDGDEGGQIRTYRVSRIREARMNDASGKRPEGFDLPSYWQESVTRFRAGLPRYVAGLRVTQEALDLLRRTPYARIQDVGSADESGWRPVSVDFETEDDACRVILGLGSQAVVLEPATLRQRVVVLLRDVLSLYSDEAAAG